MEDHIFANAAGKEGATVGKEGIVEGREVGVNPELERNFSFLSCLGMAFAMLNSWTVAHDPMSSVQNAYRFSLFSMYRAASLSVVLPSGGPVSMVWGLIASFIGTLMMCASLAEACHNFPSSGGQYDWAYLLAPKRWRNSLSYFVGWMACAAWIALVATGSSLGANFITGIIQLWVPTYNVQRWQTFLIYLAFTVGAFLLNAFAVRLLPLVDRTAFIWSLSGIVIVIITLLATSSGRYEPAEVVFTQFVNQTGWPDGMAFILGLLQSTFGLTGFDAISHMVEEMPRPSITAPKVMLMAVMLGFGTSFVFTIVILFSLSDLNAVVTSAVGPLLEIYYQSTRSKAGATCLLMFNLGAMAFATQGLMTVASRMVMSFARDRGMGPLSGYLGEVHPKLLVPFWSVLFTAIWTVIFGLIYLGSSVALNAILSSSVVFIQISYFVPIALMFFRGETALAEGQAVYSLGKFRRVVNGAAMAFALLTTVVFIFPPAIPVNATSMNYVIVVLGIVLLMWGCTWVFHGMKKFSGPSDLEGRLMRGRSH